MCAIDLEPSEVWQQTWIKRARKDHSCDSCGRTIRAGEPYERHFSVYEGTPHAEKVCAECYADREEFFRAHDTVGIPSQFADLLNDCIADGDEESDQRWRPMLDALKQRGASACSPA